MNFEPILKAAVESRVEAHVERKIDSLDRRYLDGQLTRAEYEAAMRDIDLWAKATIADILSKANVRRTS